MSISLKQLRSVAAVARTGHFGRAAAACAVTQSALSQQIQAVESACGAALFDRLPRGTRLTPFGREFVDLAQIVLEAADALSAFTQSRSSNPLRPLRFGLIPTVAPYLLPEIFPVLQADFPELHFAVSENRTEALLGGLADSTLDLALIATLPKPGGPKLTVSPLFADEFVLATSNDEKTPEPVRLGAIDTSRMLLLDEGHCFRDQAIAACALDPTVASRTFAATSLSTIVEFVANGQGVTLLPAIALRKEATGDRIAVHRLAAPGAGRMLSLVWRESTPFATLFEKLAGSIRATCGDLARGAVPPHGIERVDGKR